MNKKYLFILASLISAVSCSEIEMPVYKEEDSAVMFLSQAQDFSLKGVTDEKPHIKVDIKMFGPVSDIDRTVSIAVVDSSANSATQNVDFTIAEAVVKAGEMKGYLDLEVKKLEEGVEKRTVVLEIVPNEFFKYKVKNLNMSEISWSELYVRPHNAYVFKTWYYFFCPGYSRNLHQLLVDCFGPEIEISSYVSSARKDENFIFHTTNWWYDASRTFYDFVKTHDQANPDDPYMHSSDFEVYNSYDTAVGAGTKPESIPTILSTLILQ